MLAPDNVGSRAQLSLGAGRAIEAPGTSQAFHRSSIVTVVIDGSQAQIRRPDLVGALFGKAAAVVKITSQSAAGRAKHRRDFDSLAKLLGAADRGGAQLTRSERKMIVAVAEAPELSALGVASLRLLVERAAS